MAQQTINVGAAPNDGTGTPLRTAFQYTNQNFTELYTALGGGVGLPGATTQVIFNDGGTNLAGDAGLVYNKTTDTLTAGNATITGALTVDTTTLVVNPSGYADRVGILTASPTHSLDVRGIIKSNGTFTAYINPSFSGAAAIQTESAESLILAPSGQESLRCAPSGVYTFGDGAGGTRMTLNSTGLGVGAVPSGNNQLTVRSSGAGTEMTASFGRASQEGLIGIAAGTNGFVTGSIAGDMVVRSNGKLMLFNNTANSGITIDTAANVGIGVTPSAWGGSYKALQLLSVARSIAATGAGSGDLTVAFNAIYDSTDSRWEYAGTGDKAGRYSQTGSGNHRWFVSNTTGTAGNEITDFASAAMTLDASGNLLLGKTTTAATALGGVAYIGRVDCSRDTGNAATFNHTTAGNLVGNIAITSTATTYNSASDYRLKEAVQPLSGGLARVSALKPSIYKWKVDGSSGEGFLAHELADVVPLAVTGEKDAVDADGKPEYQGVDLSKVVPILVAAIQELTARVQTLETR